MQPDGVCPGWMSPSEAEAPLGHRPTRVSGEQAWEMQAKSPGLRQSAGRWQDLLRPPCCRRSGRARRLDRLRLRARSAESGSRQRLVPAASPSRVSLCRFSRPGAGGASAVSPSSVPPSPRAASPCLIPSTGSPGRRNLLLAPSPACFVPLRPNPGSLPSPGLRTHSPQAATDP